MYTKRILSYLLQPLDWPRWQLLLLRIELNQRSGDMNAIASIVAGLRLSYVQPVLRKLDAQIGHSSYIETGQYFHNAKLNYANLKIGAKVYIGPQSFFDLSSHIHIEDRATIAMRCTILTHFDPGSSDLGMFSEIGSDPVKIGVGAYLGAHALIFPGVLVGNGAVVAAGAVVTNDVPDYALVAGVPAKLVRKLQ